MNEDRLNRLNLFEALVFGIYGNWLISFIDKISFLKFPVSFNIFFWSYQFVCVALAFSSLLLLFGFSIFRPNETSKLFMYIMYLGHAIGIFGAFTVEGWTVSNLSFYFIGLTLFLIIFLIEGKRVRIQRESQ